MAPVKFDDLAKTATSLLDDDFQTKGYQLKTKQKTSYGGSVLSAQVDLFGKDACQTPAKLTWKWPSPLGFGQVNIDKLEMDKAGKFKLEASSDKAHPGLKVEVKHDLVGLKKLSVGGTYTGVKDTQIKFETKAADPKDFAAEVTHTRGAATVGIKLTKAMLEGTPTPDLGVRFTSGGFFGALVAKQSFGKLGASVHYKANPDFNVAANYDYQIKDKKGDGSIGVAYKGVGKVKVTQNQVVSASVKHSLAKGFTLLAGAAYNAQAKDSPLSYGLQLSIE